MHTSNEQKQQESSFDGAWWHHSTIHKMPHAGELCLFPCLPVSPHSCCGLSPVSQHWTEEVWQGVWVTKLLLLS